MKTLLKRSGKSESGQILPIALVTLFVGSLILLPSLNYVATNLKAQTVMKQNIKAAYASEAGIEDGAWRLMNTVVNFDSKGEYSYDLPGTVNTMTVNVTISNSVLIGGEWFGETSEAEHNNIRVSKAYTYDPTLDEGNGGYIYTVNITNVPTQTAKGNIKLQGIGIDFSPGVSYIPGSTSGNITTDDPARISGGVDTGFLLEWELQPPFPEIREWEMKSLIFQLAGPPDKNISSFVVFEVGREDQLSAELSPYKISATAKDSSGEQQKTIVVIVWQSQDNIVVRNWRVIP